MAKRIKIPYRPDEPSRKPASEPKKAEPVKPPMAPLPPSKIVYDKKAAADYTKSEQGQQDMQGSYDQDIMIEDYEKEQEIKNAPPLPADEPSEEEKKAAAQKKLMEEVQKKTKPKLKAPAKGK